MTNLNFDNFTPPMLSDYSLLKCDLGTELQRHGLEDFQVVTPDGYVYMGDSYADALQEFKRVVALEEN